MSDSQSLQTTDAPSVVLVCRQTTPLCQCARVYSDAHNCLGIVADLGVDAMATASGCRSILGTDMEACQTKCSALPSCVIRSAWQICVHTVRLAGHARRGAVPALQNANSSRKRKHVPAQLTLPQLRLR